LSHCLSDINYTAESVQTLKKKFSEIMKECPQCIMINSTASSNFSRIFFFQPRKM
jgi:hypothetical protein